MKRALKYILLFLFTAFPFFIFGMKVGKLQAKDGVYDFTIFWSWLVDLGTILAGLGTVIAAYVGYLALNNWKSQSKGESSLARLLKVQENIAIICCEFLTRTTSLMGKEKEELYDLIKITENNLSILSRQITPNDEILEMKKLLFMPKVRIRDSGVLWDDEKEKLRELETKLNSYIEKQ